jgi:hypothetical protein
MNILCTSCVLAAESPHQKRFRMSEILTTDALPYEQTLYAQTKPSKIGNTLITKGLVRPSGFEPPTFCSGGSQILLTP